MPKSNPYEHPHIERSCRIRAPKACTPLCAFGALLASLNVGVLIGGGLGHGVASTITSEASRGS